MNTITVERTIKAPLEKVWAVAGKFSQAPGPSISVVVEKEGDSASHGIGTERTITFRGARVHERLESIDPPNSFTYKIISGAPVKSYLGRAEFRPHADSTLIKWSGEFTVKIPGTAWLVAKVATNVINQYIDELESIK